MAPSRLRLFGVPIIGRACSVVLRQPKIQGIARWVTPALPRASPNKAMPSLRPLPVRGSLGDGAAELVEGGRDSTTRRGRRNHCQCELINRALKKHKWEPAGTERQAPTL